MVVIAIIARVSAIIWCFSILRYSSYCRHSDNGVDAIDSVAIAGVVNLLPIAIIKQQL